jgi:hypothetical protein
MNSKPSRAGAPLVITMMILATLFALCGGCGTLTFGNVRGTEFSPTHFQARDFSYYEIPWLRVQITPVQRTFVTNSVCLYLASQNLINVASGPPTHWDLIRVDGLSGGENDGAMISPYLQLESGYFATFDRLQWDDWSRKYPSSAKVLWPRVQEASIAGLYVLVPAMFDLAVEHASDSNRLTIEIDDYLRTELLEVCRDLGEAEDRRAEAAITFAKRRFPNDPQIQQLAP